MVLSVRLNDLVERLITPYTSELHRVEIMASPLITLEAFLAITPYSSSTIFLKKLFQPQKVRGHMISLVVCLISIFPPMYRTSALAKLLIRHYVKLHVHQLLCQPFHSFYYCYIHFYVRTEWLIK